MASKRTLLAAIALAVAAGMVLLLTGPKARADDYTDLLDLLRAKGTISQDEYQTLLSKHTRNARAPAARPARAQADKDAPTTAAPATEAVEASKHAAQKAAAEAAASAAAAQAAVQQAQSMMDSSDLVRAKPYTPGKGVTLGVGSVDLNFSGFINGFYTFATSERGPNTTVLGGLAEASGFDESSVRNGLLPAGLLFKATTTQNGFDLSAVFGMYPGLNDAKGGALGANSGGSPLGLGTPGIDFRQAYVTFGNNQWGTVKVGRDIGIFGSDAILNDATLLSVGATGSNQNPANTALGRIGLGYIYADWIPQISYASPILAGFQETVGVLTPLDEFNNSGLSASSTAHDTPMFQGKITWDYKAEPLYYKAEPSYKAEPFAVRIWTSGLFQPQQGIVLTTPTGPVQTQQSATAAAVDVGTKVDFDPFSLVAYYYWGRGVGTTALFFDGLSPTGETRDSEGYYIQGSWKPIPKLKLVASYGQSSLDLAPGDTNAELLVRRNAAWIGGAYYSLTDWLTLVGEYAYVTAQAQGGNQAIEHSFDIGTFLAF